jgi:hypothetical protein
MLRPYTPLRPRWLLLLVAEAVLTTFRSKAMCVGRRLDRVERKKVVPKRALRKLMQS